MRGFLVAFALLASGCGRLVSSSRDAGAGVADAASTDLPPGDGPRDSGGALASVLKLLSVGSGHVCAVRGGVVTCAGGIRAGAVGYDPSGRARVVRLPGPATDISSTGNSCCALTQGGDVYCWGDGYLGLGGSEERVSEPTTPTVARASLVDGTTGHCALVQGQAYCWGYLPDVDPHETAVRPRPIGMGGSGESIAAGGRHLCALGADHVVRCRGANDRGQCGQAPTPVLADWSEIPNLTDARDLRAGADSTCVLRSSGVVSCWGSNRYGTLGAGAGGDRAESVDVTGLGGVSQFDVFGANACAVAAGSVWCWGTRMMGQIGDGRRVFDAADPAFLQPTPMRVAGITDVLEVAVGPSMVCAMRRDNSIWCWGLNNNAPLPWASNTVSVPVQVMAADGG